MILKIEMFEKITWKVGY